MSQEIPTDTAEAAPENRFQSIMGWIAAILIVIFSLVCFGYFIKAGFDEKIWLSLAKEHFPAVLGPPIAALTALFVVLVLRLQAGPIEVEMPGIKFKGAAAPIVFWVVCFLAVAGVYKMLWNP